MNRRTFFDRIRKRCRPTQRGLISTHCCIKRICSAPHRNRIQKFAIGVICIIRRRFLRRSRRFFRRLRHGRLFDNSSLRHEACSQTSSSCRIHRFRTRSTAHIAFHLHSTTVSLFPVNQVAGTAKRANAFLDFQNLQRIHVAFVQAEFFFQTQNFRILINAIAQRRIVHRPLHITRVRNRSIRQLRKPCSRIPLHPDSVHSSTVIRPTR